MGEFTDFKGEKYASYDAFKTAAENLLNNELILQEIISSLSASDKATYSKSVYDLQLIYKSNTVKETHEAAKNMLMVFHEQIKKSSPESPSFMSPPMLARTNKIVEFSKELLTIGEASKDTEQQEKAVSFYNSVNKLLNNEKVKLGYKSANETKTAAKEKSSSLKK